MLVTVDSTHTSDKHVTDVPVILPPTTRTIFEQLVCIFQKLCEFVVGGTQDFFSVS